MTTKMFSALKKKSTIKYYKILLMGIVPMISKMNFMGSPMATVGINAIECGTHIHEHCPCISASVPFKYFFINVQQKIAICVYYQH